MPAKPARCQCCKSLSWVTQLWDSETQTQSRQRTLSGGVSKTTWGRYYMNFWVGVSRKDPKNPELVQLHQESHLIQQKQGDGPPTKSFILPSSVLHHIRKPVPDQKPVIPIHSSKFKSPFHSSSQEPKKPIRPSLRRNGSKILGEKKEEVRKLSIPHLLPWEQWFTYHPYQEKWIWQDLASSKFFKIFMLEKSSVWNFCALSQTSFGGETSGSVAKSRRFSQTKNFFPASLSLVSQKPGYEVTVGTVYVPIHQVRTKTLRRNSAK